jgi:hypothetical protein
VFTEGTGEPVQKGVDDVGVVVELVDDKVRGCPSVFL